MSREGFRIEVDCHAGYRGEESPRRFRFGTREVGVAKIRDRWLAPDHRYFKVIGTDGDLYILRHDPERDLWTLAFHAAPGRGSGTGA